MMAIGVWYSLNASLKVSLLALITGSVGTGNGRRHITTALSISWDRSTPSQKLAVPRIMAVGLLRKLIHNLVGCSVAPLGHHRDAVVSPSLA